MISARVFLVGNVGKAPESSYTPNGKFISKFSFAVTTGWGDNKATDWYNITAWEKTGEMVQKLVDRGTGLVIEGELSHRTWTDKEGVEHISNDVTMKDFNVTARGKEKSDEDQTNPYDNE